jgi:putative ABC transport system permease protein
MATPPAAPPPAAWARVPLARRMLLHRKPRFVLSLAGVAFAVLVMFMQIGFLSSNAEGHRNLLPRIQGDLAIHARERETVGRVARTFDRTRLAQARALPEVAAVVPLYEGYVSIKNPDTDRLRFIHTLAFPLGEGTLALDGLGDGETKLRRPRTFFWDERTRPLFGDLRIGSAVELNGTPLGLVGFYRLGPNVYRDGYAVMSAETYFEIGGRPDRISTGIVRLQPGADPAAVRDRLRAVLPDDVQVHRLVDLIKREDRYAVLETPTGVIFGGGLVLGFVIGIVICYQILFNEVLDHLPQYATLKAIGFTERYLRGIVLKEALYLALFGFLPGLLGALTLYAWLGSVSGMTMVVTWPRALLVFFLTVPMCCAAGLLALRRVQQADPAEVF